MAYKLPPADPRLGMVLRKARLSANLSQGQLAMKAKWPRFYVSKLENARMSPNFQTVMRFAVGVGIPAWKIVRAYERSMEAK